MDVPSTIMIKGIEMIYVPAGSFIMGSKGEGDRPWPPHEVHSGGFYISRYEVTNPQYREFVSAADHLSPSLWKTRASLLGAVDHPVVLVSWHDALAYCSWLSEETGQEIRLPTEAEWEKAARGTDGRRYPWGNEFDKAKCNSLESGIGDTTSVGKYSPGGDSPYGVAGMAGNVWDWCSSLYEPYPYDPDDGREDLEARGGRVLRGSCFRQNRNNVVCVSRTWADPRASDHGIGFRVVVSPGSPE